MAAAPGLPALKENFPGAVYEEAFVNTIAEKLAALGFHRNNSIAFSCTCRDEICRPLNDLIERAFGYSFSLSGLGGLLTCGKTGLAAGMHHSPQTKSANDDKPRERYIFFAFPHTAVGLSGEVGSIMRLGREQASGACGALIGIMKDINSGKPVEDDPEDPEYSIMKKKVHSKVSNDSGLDLVKVTKAAQEVITEDLEELISKGVHTESADYAVIAGTQIHINPGETSSPGTIVNYIAPGKLYAVVNGQKHDLSLGQA